MSSSNLVPTRFQLSVKAVPTPYGSGVGTLPYMYIRASSNLPRGRAISSMGISHGR